MIPQAFIVDYGVGNLYSIKCALEKAGFRVTIGLEDLTMEEAEIIILPGVGDFSAASKNLAPIREKLLELSEKEVEIFGICLGMQLLLERSEEGEGCGLELIKGVNVKLPASVKVPHMGWNTINIKRQNRLVEGLSDGAYFYFAHSYYPVPVDDEAICAETTYGATFASIISKKNIHGTQFHPEKSGKNGLKLLENLINIVRR